MKFTEEELSRILSAHEGGQLKAHGEYWVEGMIPSYCCINQAAKNNSNPFLALLVNSSAAHWFDCMYRSFWSTQKFLNELGKNGWA